MKKRTNATRLTGGTRAHGFSPHPVTPTLCADGSTSDSRLLNSVFHHWTPATRHSRVILANPTKSHLKIKLSVAFICVHHLQVKRPSKHKITKRTHLPFGSDGCLSTTCNDCEPFLSAKTNPFSAGWITYSPFRVQPRLFRFSNLLRGVSPRKLGIRNSKPMKDFEIWNLELGVWNFADRHPTCLSNRGGSVTFTPCCESLFLCPRSHFASAQGP
jgi:hypothetical protein